MIRIPDPLTQFLVVLDTQRCPRCWGLTANAAALGVQGSFCQCPFDSEDVSDGHALTGTKADPMVSLSVAWSGMLSVPASKPEDVV